jgi:MFS family permease
MIKGINKVVKILICSDILLQSGWGLIGPIFAIFLTKQISGGSLRMVGLVAATYWLTKSVFQPFVAHHLDKNHGEKDDLQFLVAGMIIANCIPFGYIFSTQPWHIFLLEAVRGLAMACVVPTWSGIFTRHIDKGREAFSWSLESTGLGFAAGLAGAAGGFLASSVSFKIVFLMVGFFGLASSLILLLVRKYIFLHDHFKPGVPPSEKPF